MKKKGTLTLAQCSNSTNNSNSLVDLVFIHYGCFSSLSIPCQIARRMTINYRNILLDIFAWTVECYLNNTVNKKENHKSVSSPQEHTTSKLQVLTHISIFLKLFVLACLHISLRTWSNRA